MIIKLPEYVTGVLDTLESKGYEAYVVGGCMRDTIMGRDPKDWDVATNAVPGVVMQLFEKTIPTGIKHGTVTVIYDSHPVEITTYRVESTYSDARRPDNVFFTSSLYEDLSRRDFTMNAIAYSPKRGLADYFDGINAIKSGKIYCIGNGDERFSEDALRMMRAVRFAAVLNFTPDITVVEAIRKNHKLLECISMERIRDEFLKTVMSENTEKFFLYTETGLLKVFLPELYELPHNVQMHIYSALKNIPSSRHSARLAALFSRLNPDIIPGILRRMRFDNDTVKSVSSITRFINYQSTGDVTLRKIASKIGMKNTKNLIYVWDALDIYDKEVISNINKYYNEIIEKNYCLSIESLDINGHDLKNLGIPEGEKIGTILNFLLEKVLINPTLNKKEILITIVKQNF